VSQDQLVKLAFSFRSGVVELGLESITRNSMLAVSLHHLDGAFRALTALTPLTPLTPLTALTPLTTATI